MESDERPSIDDIRRLVTERFSDLSEEIVDAVQDESAALNMDYMTAHLALAVGYDATEVQEHFGYDSQQFADAVESSLTTVRDNGAVLFKFSELATKLGLQRSQLFLGSGEDDDFTLPNSNPPLPS